MFLESLCSDVGVQGEISRIRAELARSVEAEGVLIGRVESQQEMITNLETEVQAKVKRISDLDKKITELIKEVESLKGGEEELGLIKKFLAWMKRTWNNT